MVGPWDRPIPLGLQKVQIFWLFGSFYLAIRSGVIRNNKSSRQRVNGEIGISPVRVVNEHGDMLGEMPTDQARTVAAEAGLDLVEVSPESRPPICRIMDFGKVQYERKKRTNNKSSQHQTKLKQIRLRAKTDEHDIDFKVRRAKRFLERKDKVKINVRFRGRENAHHERGREMLTDIIETLSEVATVERPPSMESGRMMTTILAPRSG